LGRESIVQPYSVTKPFVAVGGVAALDAPAATALF
jgi:hypothetical protein